MFDLFFFQGATIHGILSMVVHKPLIYLGGIHTHEKGGTLNTTKMITTTKSLRLIEGGHLGRGWVNISMYGICMYTRVIFVVYIYIIYIIIYIYIHILYIYKC